MKLRSLAVNQFKKFTTPTRLEGIEDGLNVVVGPNEMGKSTLLDALRAALFEKYSSKAQPIVALQNDRNQAAPVVELAFDLDDGLYRITKRFIKKPEDRRGRFNIGVHFADVQGGEDAGGQREWRSGIVTVRRGKTATGSAANRLHVESGRFLYDDGHSTSCEATFGKTQGVCQVGITLWPRRMVHRV